MYLVSTAFASGHLKTDPFDEKAFDNEMTVSEVKTLTNTLRCVQMYSVFLFQGI